MTPREYVDEIIRPNIAELVADPASVRLAMNAVHAVDALAARIYVAAGGRETTGEKSDTDFREGLAKADASGNFRLLRDLAKAVKHVVLDRSKVPPKVNSASQVEAKPIGSQAGEVAAGDGHGVGEFGGPTMVVVTVESGMHSVADVVCQALAFLEEEMAHRGL